jgi:hypothetical protein
VQTLPSSAHGVPAAERASAGQVAALPLHVSATSQTPAEARHVIPAARN